MELKVFRQDLSAAPKPKDPEVNGRRVCIQKNKEQRKYGYRDRMLGGEAQRRLSITNGEKWRQKMKAEGGSQATADVATAMTAATASTDPACSRHSGDVPSPMELDIEKSTAAWSAEEMALEGAGAWTKLRLNTKKTELENYTCQSLQGRDHRVLPRMRWCSSLSKSWDIAESVTERRSIRQMFSATTSHMTVRILDCWVTMCSTSQKDTTCTRQCFERRRGKLRGTMSHGCLWEHVKAYLVRICGYSLESYRLWTKGAGCCKSVINMFAYGWWCTSTRCRTADITRMSIRSHFRAGRCLRSGSSCPEARVHSVGFTTARQRQCNRRKEGM